MKPHEIQILVVDDDPTLLETMCELFEIFGFSVSSASGGNPAWEMVQKNQYHVVISDVRMPDGDGFTLAKRIRSMSPMHPRVLLVSGFTDFTLEEVFHAGVDGFFTKPFNAQSIREAIRRTLSAPEERWAAPGAKDVAVQLMKRAPSRAHLESGGEVLFGRGGLFIATTDVSSVAKSAVSFRIELDDHTPFKVLEGTGIVRWSTAGEQGPSGLGIEIVSLEGDGIVSYAANFGSQVAWIPSPRFANGSSAEKRSS